MGTKHYPLLSARAILLAMLALMTWCQPALAQDGRTPIEEVYATSNFASIPVLGERCTQPTFMVTSGSPAYFSDEGTWQMLIGTDWEDLNASEVFEAGNTYRYTVQIKIDDSDATSYYLANPSNLEVTVDGNWWTPSNYSETSVTVYSPEFVWAEPANVNYFDPTAAAGEQTKTASAILLNSGNTLLGSGWYYVDGNISISDRITVMGTVNLILADGCEFEADAGIRVAEGNTINIYAQSAGDGCGKLTASGSDDAAIGGNAGENKTDYGDPGENAGIINIYGGQVRAMTYGIIGGGCGGDGYKNGGDGGNGGIISIYGGQVDALVIGGGYGGFGDNQDGNDGDGTINLSWSSNADSIRVSNYYGTVTLLKDFLDISNGKLIEKGKVADNSTIEDIGLVPLEAIYAYKKKKPTCTEGGYAQDCWFKVATQKYYSDEGCTEEMNINPEIPALDHLIKHIAAVPATFSRSGTYEYWHCERCGVNFEDEWGNNEIDDLGTLEYEGGQGNPTDGYYILMPTSGTKTLALDGSIKTFKVYDDGGKDGNYSNYSYGYLQMSAPEGYYLQLTGSIKTWDGSAYLTVSDGKGNELLGQTYGDINNIGTINSKTLEFYFYTEGENSDAGLDLTVTLVEAPSHTITIANADGGQVTGPASAKWFAEVKLTATPEGDNLLSGITVKIDGTDDEVEVTGGTWYNPTATFTMPNANVTITPVFSADKSNLSINMPKKDTLTVQIPSDASIKIYDDGGKNDEYSEDCDGVLTLIAPANKMIQLEGTVATETISDDGDIWDYLTVYTGTTAEGDMLLDRACSEDDVEIDEDTYEAVPVSIGTLTGTSMTLYFHSDGGTNDAGLDLTVTLLDIVDGKVTVPKLTYKRNFVDPEDMDAPDATIDGVDVAVYTVCMPDDPATSGSMKYYTLSGATATSLQFTEVTEPKANKPYLVTVSEGMSWSFLEDTPITLQKECDGPTAGGFKFVGTHLGLSNAEAAAKGAYILQDGNDWGQVQAATAEHPEYGDAYVPAFRAFIVPVGGGAPLRIGTDFEESDATAIQSLQLIDKDGTENWYDLNGRRIERPTQNGIYIYNGKKVAVQ